jgi:hypothetical protein
MALFVIQVGSGLYSWSLEWSQWLEAITVIIKYILVLVGISEDSKIVVNSMYFSDEMMLAAVTCLLALFHTMGRCSRN